MRYERIACKSICFPTVGNRAESRIFPCILQTTVICRLQHRSTATTVRIYNIRSKISAETVMRIIYTGTKIFIGLHGHNADLVMATPTRCESKKTPPHGGTTILVA